MEEPERKRIVAKQLPLLFEQRAYSYRSLIIRLIFDVGGGEVGLVHVGHVLGRDNTSAYWTAGHLRNLGKNIPSELVLGHMTFHEPLSVHTDKVEPMETLINPGKVGPRSESLIFFTRLCKVLQTHQASSLDSIVVVRKYFPEGFEHSENKSRFIVFNLFIEGIFKRVFKLLLDALYLVFVQTF
jgi:hypothetical protein